MSNSYSNFDKNVWKRITYRARIESPPYPLQIESYTSYVETLYINVLNRELDQGGYDYWVGNLNSGKEERHEVLLGFSESAENKALFTDMTGFG